MKLTSRSILVSMLCAAAVTAQFVAGKATRDALFLTSLSFHALPMMLIAASVCSILLVALHSRWAAKVAPTSMIQILSAASGALFLFEWAVRFRAPAATATLLFLHTSAMGPLLTSGFWLIASESFEPRTAKRRFGQITGAGTVGGLLGALVSERVAATLGAPAMLLVLGAVQLLTVWLFSRFTAVTPHASKYKTFFCSERVRVRRSNPVSTPSRHVPTAGKVLNNPSGSQVPSYRLPGKNWESM